MFVGLSSITCGGLGSIQVLLALCSTLWFVFVGIGSMRCEAWLPTNFVTAISYSVVRVGRARLVKMWKAWLVTDFFFIVSHAVEASSAFYKVRRFCDLRYGEWLSGPARGGVGCAAFYRSSKYGFRRFTERL